MTPLMWAAWKGQTDAVKWLIAASAKLDRQEKWGRTALVLAADEGHVDVVGAMHLLNINYQSSSIIYTVRFGYFWAPAPRLIFFPCEQRAPIAFLPHSCIAEFQGTKRLALSPHQPLQKTSTCGMDNPRCK